MLSLHLHPGSRGAFLAWGSSPGAPCSAPLGLCAQLPCSVSSCHAVSAAFVSQEAQPCQTLLGVIPSKTAASPVAVLPLSLGPAGLQQPAEGCGLVQGKQAVSFYIYKKFILKRKISSFVFWHYNEADCCNTLQTYLHGYLILPLILSHRSFFP